MGICSGFGIKCQLFVRQTNGDVQQCEARICTWNLEREGLIWRQGFGVVSIWMAFKAMGMDEVPGESVVGK